MRALSLTASIAGYGGGGGGGGLFLHVTCDSRLLPTLQDTVAVAMAVVGVITKVDTAVRLVIRLTK